MNNILFSNTYLKKQGMIKCFRGYCNIFAETLSNFMYESLKDNNSISLCLERAYFYDPQMCNAVGYIHEYLCVNNNDIKLYVDIRGIYDNFEDFMKNFIIYDKKYYKPQKHRKIYTSSYYSVSKYGLLSPDDIVLFWDEIDNVSSFSKSCYWISKHGENYLNGVLDKIA